jgi:NitT/TauT family transport system substrate-binding protein
MRCWSVRVGVLLIAGVTVAAACAAPAPSPGASSQRASTSAAAGGQTAPAQPPEEVKVAAVTGINMSPYRIAQARGYYTEAGLDVTFLDFPSAVGVKAMIANEVHFSVAGGSVAAAALADVPVRVVFVATSRPLFYLYSQPSITSLRELRGQRIGISSRGSAPELVARAWMERAGVDPDESVWVLIGSGPARTQALIAGSVDAASLSSPSDLLAKRAGFRELVNFSREFRAGGLAGAGTTTEFLAQRPDVARRWLEASLKGLRYMKADRAGAIALLAPDLELDEAMTAEVYDAVIDAFTTDGLEEEADQLLEIELQKKALELEGKDIPPSRVFDLRLTREAARHLDQSGWRP